MKFLKSCLVITALMSTGVSLAADLSGSYAVTGKDSSGAAYSATLAVAPGAGGSYRLSWSGGTTAQGVGLSDGRVLVASFGPKLCGVVSYVVQPDGKLVGSWSLGQGIGSETAIPAQGAVKGLAGDYVVNGKNADGSPYKGAVLVSNGANGLALAWRTGSNDSGVGLQSGNRLVASVGPDCGVVIYNINGGRLDGQWRGTGSDRGTEGGARK